MVGGGVIWDSGPAGRGRVTERVVAYAPADGQTVEVTDDTITGRQAVTFAAVGDGVEVSVALEYRLRHRSLVHAGGGRAVHPPRDVTVVPEPLVRSFRARPRVGQAGRPASPQWAGQPDRQPVSVDLVLVGMLSSWPPSPVTTLNVSTPMNPFTTWRRRPFGRERERDRPGLAGAEAERGGRCRRIDALCPEIFRARRDGRVERVGVGQRRQVDRRPSRQSGRSVRFRRVRQGEVRSGGDLRCEQLVHRGVPERRSAEVRVAPQERGVHLDRQVGPATVASAFVPGGTSHSGCALNDSGNPTLLVSWPSSTWGTRPSNRGSTKKSLRMLPVLVTRDRRRRRLACRQTGRGASRGFRWLEICGGVNVTFPVNGSLRCVPSTGPVTVNTAIQSPPCG